ncbi:hypothetical protein ACFWVU_00750 [Streptomyces sp. NPDC058686]|uniref:hypothetical protein n=1 Tax=Streptomyces sp. NPDC058686 TaxID=3346599 RepID=UPI00365426AA
MARGSRRTAEQIADGIAQFCENIERTRATLARAPADGTRLLDELLDALRNGTDPSEQLEAVHHALRRGQDAIGVFGRTRDISMATPPGIPPARTDEPVLLCPRADNPCTRYGWPTPGSTHVCHVTGTPLRRSTLAT